MSNRDNFTPSTKQTIARRAGYRCSNPTCRRGTHMPNPVNTDASISQGEAAHIRAASPGGARYDATMTPQQRKAAANGIWLCENCAKIVDAAPDAFPVETLVAWKRRAEITATRDARAKSDEIVDLVKRIDLTCVAVLEHHDEWNRREPPWNFEEFERSRQLSSEHSTNRRAAYYKDVSPLVIDVLMRSQTVLGIQDVQYLATEQAADAAPVNPLCLMELLVQLQELRTILQLR